MEYEEILSKLKENNDIELYQAVTEMKTNTDKTIKEKDEELEALKKSNEDKDKEVKKAQDKVWEYIMKGEKEKEEFKRTSTEHKPKTIDDYFK